MADDYDRLEAERLIAAINRAENQIERLAIEIDDLTAELELALENVAIVASNCDVMSDEVALVMDGVSKEVLTADIDTREVFQALQELTFQYFTFKTISTASKNVTSYNDEYFTRFSYYNELRRITLGYIIGVDSNIISSETARKKVEKAYLKNTEYWLAYCITSVMLWVSDEKEAAYRALNKALRMDYFDAVLFYLLVNLRFNRIDAAKQWYVKFLERVDANKLGDEWQYLLQAYLYGAFGADNEFQSIIEENFKKMLLHAEETTVDFEKRFSNKAYDFAKNYPYKTRIVYTFLGRNCSEYDNLQYMLSCAEKNAILAKHYNDIYEEEVPSDSELPNKIEDVLYDLINGYEAEEEKLIRSIKYNEAIINARGDINLAQQSFNESCNNKDEKNMADLLLDWAFATDINQTNVLVKRFAISLTKKPIEAGIETYISEYRQLEKDKYEFDIDGCKLVCNENDYALAEKELDAYYAKGRVKNILKDKYVLLFIGVCFASLMCLLLLIPMFNPALLIVGIILGLIGSFLLWRRIVDVKKILMERLRKGKLILRQTLDELRQWRKAYKESDVKAADIITAIEQI